MHLGFFRFKHSVTIAEQEKNFIWKVSTGGHPLKKIPCDHGDMVTRYADAGRVQTILKKISQNHKEILVLIILGSFSINKTQK
jgi:hypothetical protein